MVSIRWADGIVRCPHCGHDQVAYLEKAKLYFCPKKHDKQKFSLKVGTIFEASPISLEKWLPAAWLIANCKNGISSYEIARALGVTQKTAWFMLHRIREAMERKSIEKMGGPESGPVEVDELFFGPKPSKMHADRRMRLKKALYAGSKATVCGILDRELREVRAKVIPNVSRQVLQNEILNEVQPGSKVYTDGWAGYDGMAKEYVHETVNHMKEFVRGEVHTQGIDNFWSMLRRTLGGTYIAVEPFHLDRYLAEQVFRYNNRATKDNPLNDADRFALLVTQVVGKRLTYAELTGKDQERPF
jgi:transposase-like protein